jgi:hypothetical protein
VAVRDVELVTTTPAAAAVPKSTVLSLENPVPVTVTEVPPAVEPVLGLMAVTVGAPAPPV